MVKIRRVSPKELKRIRTLSDVAEAPPAGIAPVLRASWKFARDTAHRFSRELSKNRAKEFLKKLVKRFI